MGRKSIGKSMSEGKKNRLKGSDDLIASSKACKDGEKTAIKPQMKRFKKKSKMKPKKKLENDVPDRKKVDKDKKEPFSSNWDAFMKELKVQKKPAIESKKKHTNVQKRKLHPKNNNHYLKRNRMVADKEDKVEEPKIMTQSDIWFDDVDIEDIENAIGKKLRTEKDDKLGGKHILNGKEEDDHLPSITKRLAIDCEMVGVGIDGKESMLARVSIVNSFGDKLYDSFVAPMQKVVDYRTEFSGVRPENLANAPSFKEVQETVANLTNGKILVGHAIHNDLKVLLLSHSRKDTRDTSTYKPFKTLLKTRYPSLKKLAKEILNVDIQSGEHSSVEDARYTMKIYQLHKRRWEKDLKEKGHRAVVHKSPMIFNNKELKATLKRVRAKRIQKARKGRKIS